MHDVNKTHNIILKTPWFHTPASHFPQNGNFTMGEIAKQKMANTSSLHIFGGSLFSSFAWHTYQRQNQGNTSKGNIWIPFYITKDGGLGGG